MERVKVESSNIRSVGYDKETGVLEIEFSNDSIFQYDSIQPETHNALMTSKSKGKYFHNYIKNFHSSTRIK